MTRLLLVVMLTVMVTAGVSLATTLPSSPKTATATVIPVAEEPGKVTSGSRTPTAGAVVYEALSAGGTFLATGATSPIDNLPYIEYGDDCHLANIGALLGFTMGYYKPGPSSCSALITLYENDGVDGVLGPIVAGPYLVTGLPSGLNLVMVTPPDSPFLPADVWFAVEFSPNTAGLVTALDAPTIGTSHDVFVDTGLTPPAGLVWFGGDPVANFMISIEADVSVATEVTTWGRVKALYETD